ncbi:type 4a pilus biogenesis protein PilO [Parathalassolituus penaei]|uniref:Type 4a pilus biogenesis protein PilO n=1 Tax=Parathalassolituus penaei TaxID=2997323 RepID=A0A9X3IUH4_9GAMM|nr:type 4a pilus biogenesis protein PilO [Parathalassolituus penaei]MCY0967370.1 type 4a pilus biogenesis protein PilO [Parathalassolituus penaei]
MAKGKSLDVGGLFEQLKSIDPNDINNIDWEDMGSWPIAGKIFFAFLVAVAVMVGGYFFLVDDLRGQLANSISKEEVLKKDVEQKSFRVANLDPYREQLKEMEETFGTLLKQLPKDTEVPGLIDDISATALGAGLQLNAIAPESIVQTEFYKELPINIRVAGGYHEMGAFVSGVAALPRIVTLHDFTIVADKDGELSMMILAKTYQYGSDESGGKSGAPRPAANRNGGNR